MKFAFPMIFALCTALCWGLYGPAAAKARSNEKPAAWSPFKPYVFIGIAYLVLACGGGAMGMKMRGDTFDFTGKQSPAAVWGFNAGLMGALGALCLTCAMASFPAGMKPKPELVMPIVFGGAVIVNALTQVYFGASATQWLWIGIAITFLGVVTVAYNTPHGGPAHSPSAASSPASPPGHDSGGQQPH